MTLLEDARTPGTPGTCEYVRCRRPAVGELRGHSAWRPDRLPWSMCEVHVQPEMHPADLRKRLVKWT
jgi:hypothetical protein